MNQIGRAPEEFEINSTLTQKEYEYQFKPYMLLL